MFRRHQALKLILLVPYTDLLLVLVGGFAWKGVGATSPNQGSLGIPKPCSFAITQDRS